MDERSFKFNFITLPSVPSNELSKERLIDFLVASLSLGNTRSSNTVPKRLFELFFEISKINEGKFKFKDSEFDVFEGAMRVDDIYKILKTQDVTIGIAQLYNNYLTALLRLGLITKRKGSYYGLRNQTFYDSFKEIRYDLSKEFEKLLEHAKELDKLKK